MPALRRWPLAASSARDESAGRRPPPTRDRAPSAASPRGGGRPSPCRPAPSSAPASRPPRRTCEQRAERRRARGDSAASRWPNWYASASACCAVRRLDLAEPRARPPRGPPGSSAFRRSSRRSVDAFGARSFTSASSTAGSHADPVAAASSSAAAARCPAAACRASTRCAARTLQTGSGSRPERIATNCSGSSRGRGLQRRGADRRIRIGERVEQHVGDARARMPPSASSASSRTCGLGVLRLDQLQQRPAPRGSPIRPSARTLSIDDRALAARQQPQQRRHGRRVLQPAEPLRGKRARVGMRLLAPASTSAGSARLSSRR